MKITIRPRSPERKPKLRRYAVADGDCLLASGKAHGTLAEVRAYAKSLVPRGAGMFDFSTGKRRVTK